MPPASLLVVTFVLFLLSAGASTRRLNQEEAESPLPASPAIPDDAVEPEPVPMEGGPMELGEEPIPDAMTPDASMPSPSPTLPSPGLGEVSPPLEDVVSPMDGDDDEPGLVEGPSPSEPPPVVSPPTTPTASPPVVSPPPPSASMCDPALCQAALIRDDSVVRAAIADGVPDLCDCICDETTGDTLLHVTACAEAVAFAILLLEPPPSCDPDVMDAAGNSPLHEAAGCCNAPMTFNFLRFDADTEKLNDAGMTPLCVVALQDSETCGQLVVQLVEFGADICAECPTDEGPMLPVDVAVNLVVKNVIIQNGGNPVELDGTC